MAPEQWPDERQVSMSYVAKVLQPGESIVHATGLHWLLYLPAIGLAIVAAALAILSTQLGSQATLAAQIGAAAFAVLAFVAWLRALIWRRTTELVVTDRRVIYKRGLVRRHTIEMNLSKVESVDVDQSIPGRLLNYGTLTIRGTGGGLEPLPRIEAPLAFRNHVTAA